MPRIGETITNEAKQVNGQPWFGNSKIALAVQNCVKKNIDPSTLGRTAKGRALLINLTPKERKQVIDLYNDWKGEVALKVRRALEISSHSGLGRQY